MSTEKKVVLCGMKVSPETAKSVLQLYEGQREKEGGIPFKGYFVGELFENALIAAVTNGKDSGQSSTHTAQTIQKPEKSSYKLVAIILLFMVIILAAILVWKLKQERENEA